MGFNSVFKGLTYALRETASVLFQTPFPQQVTFMPNARSRSV